MMATQNATSRRKPRDLLSLITEYTPLKDAKSRTDKVAHFLDWMVHKSPYTPIAYNLILRAVDQLGRTPSAQGAEVALLSSSMPNVRKKLMTDYGRGLATYKGVGVRATVDDDDLANTQLRANVSRFVGAKTSMENTRKLINASAMQDKGLQSWVTNGVSRMLNEVNADNRLAKLLPPKVDTDEKK